MERPRGASARRTGSGWSDSGLFPRFLQVANSVFTRVDCSEFPTPSVEESRHGILLVQRTAVNPRFLQAVDEHFVKKASKDNLFWLCSLYKSVE